MTFSVDEVMMSPIGYRWQCILQFFIFKMVAICHLAYLDHPRRVLGGLYHCAKFGCDQRISFDNMKISQGLFHAFGLKTPIHATKLGFGIFYPLNGVQY